MEPFKHSFSLDQSETMPELPVDLALLKLINELENLSNFKLSFFKHIFYFQEKILVLIKKQAYQKFLHEININLKNNLETKLPRIFYIRKYAIGIVLMIRCPSDGL